MVTDRRGLPDRRSFGDRRGTVPRMVHVTWVGDDVRFAFTEQAARDNIEEQITKAQARDPHIGGGRWVRYYRDPTLADV